MYLQCFLYSANVPCRICMYSLLPACYRSVKAIFLVTSGLIISCTKKKKKITWTCWWWDERSSLLPANPTKQSTDTWGLVRSCLWKQWTYHFCDKWQCYAFRSFFCTCMKINWIDHLTHLKKRYATLILHEVFAHTCCSGKQRKYMPMFIRYWSLFEQD